MFTIFSSFWYFGTVTSAMINDELDDEFIQYPVLSSNDSVSDHVSLKAA